MSSSFVDIDWRGRRVRIEHAFIAPERKAAPLVVFLHEGLGSVSMWRDFPQRLCDAAGVRGLVYSRPGYGRSTPRAPDERWLNDFMHRQAFEVLPALLQALEVTEPPWLLGHSDGGSIALLHAARHASSHWLPVLRALGTQPWFGGRLLVSSAHKVFNENGELVDEVVRKHLRDFLRGFGQFVQANVATPG